MPWDAQEGGQALSEVHRALVVEDDPDVRELVVMSLEMAGLEVSHAATGADAVRLARELDPDLVTLDLTLPDADGMEVCRQLREFTDAYIIMVTGRADDLDRFGGLEVGADEYLPKPFSPQELRTRAAVLLRRPRLSKSRTEPTGPADVTAGRLLVSPARQEATLDGEPLDLSSVEVGVLAALAREPGRVWEREELTREVWPGEHLDSDYLVDIHVGSLRRQLRRPGDRHRWIATVGGTAYRLDPA